MCSREDDTGRRGGGEGAFHGQFSSRIAYNTKRCKCLYYCKMRATCGTDLPELSCASAFAPFSSSRPAILAIPSGDVLVRETPSADSGCDGDHAL